MEYYCNTQLLSQPSQKPRYASPDYIVKTISTAVSLDASSTNKTKEKFEQIIRSDQRLSALPEPVGVIPQCPEATSTAFSSLP
jgi:hypothetical protein